MNTTMNTITTMTVCEFNDEICMSSTRFAKMVVGFMPKSDLKSFSHNRKISNSIQGVFIGMMEMESSLIIPKRERVGAKRRVYFADDVTLPSNERSKLVTLEVHQHLNPEEYMEMMNYRDCHKNPDYLDGMRRRCEEQRAKVEVATKVTIVKLTPEKVIELQKQIKEAKEKEEREKELWKYAEWENTTAIKSEEYYDDMDHEYFGDPYYMYDTEVEEEEDV